MSSVPDYRMHRSVASIVGRGRVKYVSDSGVVQILQVQMNGLEIPDNRYRVAEFGFTSNPPIDSDVIALHVAGDRSAGAVIGTNHQASRPTGLSAGESMIYSQDGKQIYLTADGGIVVEAKGQDVVVNDAANVTWNCTGDFTLNVGGKFNVVAPGGTNLTTPTVKSTGDIQDNESTNSHTMSQMRSIFNSHTHNIASVQTGGSTVTSNAPNQTE